MEEGGGEEAQCGVDGAAGVSYDAEGGGGWAVRWLCGLWPVGRPAGDEGIPQRCGRSRAAAVMSRPICPPSLLLIQATSIVSSPSVPLMPPSHARIAPHSGRQRAVRREPVSEQWEGSGRSPIAVVEFPNRARRRRRRMQKERERCPAIAADTEQGDSEGMRNTAHARRLRAAARPQRLRGDAAAAEGGEGVGQRREHGREPRSS